MSFTTADGNPGYPSYQTISDRDITLFYNFARTGYTGSWDRHYSIVAATDQSLAQRCGLLQEGRDMPISFKRPPLAPARVPVVVIRQLLPRGGIQRGDEGEETDELKSQCLAPNGTLTCDLKKAAQLLMKEAYPTVEVFSCDPKTAQPVQLY